MFKPTKKDFLCPLRMQFMQIKIQLLAITANAFMGRLVLMLTVFLFSSVVQAKDRVALVVGNAAYKSSPLANSLNDARDISAELKRNGFEVIELLDATRREMRNGLRRFNNSIKKDSVALFYYAGHGMQVGGENYLLPLQANMENEFEVPDEALGVSSVLRAMATSQSALNLVVLDACRDNPYSRRWRSNATRGLTRVENPPQSTLMFYSASPGEVAEDGRGQNSPFTEALLTEIRQRPEQEISQLFIKTTRAVHEKTGGKQTPYVEGVLLRDFSFQNDVRLSGFSVAEPQRPEKVSRQQLVFAERSMGLTRDEKRQVQRALNGIGIIVGQADGIWGRRTRDGLKTWQHREGLSDTGYLDESSYKKFVAELLIEGPVDPPMEVRRSYEPDMVRIAGGVFDIGSASGALDEQPVHAVHVKDFDMGRSEVTLSQWRAFVKDSGCKTEAEKEGGCYVHEGGEWKLDASATWRRAGYEQEDSHPVVCVSWNDAKAYVKWLNANTQGGYRLPSEAEWEYAARAGSRGKYHFGDSESWLCSYANYADKASGLVWADESCTDGHERTAPVGSYRANSNGLYDVHGNVWEWIEDCWHESYDGAPRSGEFWGAEDGGDCGLRVLRSGSWDDLPGNLRSPNRGRGEQSYRSSNVGFRLSRTLSP